MGTEVWESVALIPIQMTIDAPSIRMYVKRRAAGILWRRGLGNDGASRVQGMFCCTSGSAMGKLVREPLDNSLLGPQLFARFRVRELVRLDGVRI